MSPALLTGRLAPISLMALARHDGGVAWQVNQPIEGLTTLTPVRGQILARHLGKAIEIHAQADAIVTLRCDRCLQHYNHGLQVQQRELLDIAPTSAAAAIPAPAPAAAGDHELTPDERLDPRGSFDPERWLFEQLSLQQPTVNRCGADCPGPSSWGDGHDAGDPRWAALGRLRPS